MDTDFKKILDAINKQYAHWGTGIPENALITKHSGYIRAGGWTLVWVFRDTYLELYTGHRHPGTAVYQYFINEEGNVDSKEVPDDEVDHEITFQLGLR